VRVYLKLVPGGRRVQEFWKPADGYAALELVARHRPKWVLLDLNLPCFDGLAVFRRLAEVYPNIPVIVVASQSDRQTVVECQNSGALADVLKQSPRVGMRRDLALAIETPGDVEIVKGEAGAAAKVDGTDADIVRMDIFAAGVGERRDDSGGQPGLRVLIVDDESHVRTYLRMVLRKLGVMDAWEAGSGEAALALYADHRPDAVLLDVNMPYMQGTDVLDRLLAFDPEAAVVMVTSNQTGDTIRAAGELGAIGYVLKQLPPAKLQQSLGEILAEIEPHANTSDV
jgi:DNA-binding NarL/FixJ family response regulator